MWTIYAATLQEGTALLLILRDHDRHEVWGDIVKAATLEELVTVADRRLEPTAYVRSGPWLPLRERVGDAVPPGWMAPAALR